MKKIKPLQKKKHQRLTTPVVAPEPVAEIKYRISRKKFRQILRRAKASGKSREPELKYPTINPAIMRALRNSNVRFGNLSADWIEQYKTQAVTYREGLLKAALETMAQIEATRKASDNLIYDYGMPYGLDAAEIVNVTMKILSMRSLELFMHDLPENVRNKMLELHAEQLFSVAGRPPPSPYKLAPSNSPFKIGSPAGVPLNGMDGFSTPVAGQSMSEALPPPATGKNLMPPRGLTM